MFPQNSEEHWLIFYILVQQYGEPGQIIHWSDYTEYQQIQGKMKDRNFENAHKRAKQRQFHYGKKKKKSTSYKTRKSNNFTLIASKHSRRTNCAKLVSHIINNIAESVTSRQINPGRKKVLNRRDSKIRTQRRYRRNNIAKYYSLTIHIRNEILHSGRQRSQ